MAGKVTEIAGPAAFQESIASQEAILVYFSYGPRSAETPSSLGDEFDPEFEKFGTSDDVVPQLYRVIHSDATKEIFTAAGISAADGGGLVLYRDKAQLGNIPLRALQESDELGSEVAQWLSGSFPVPEGMTQPPPPPPSAVPVASPSPSSTAAAPGQTPGASCGAAPKGPPPGPKSTSSQPSTTVTFGAALSGPPPGPKAAACPVPGQTPGASCGAAPKGPPPGPKSTSSQPGTTVTCGAALSGPPPGPKAAACPVPGQTPGASCGAAPKGAPPGPKSASSQPSTTVTFGAALSGPPPGPKAAACPVPGQTPGASCGAAPKGPPPGPKSTSSQPSTTVTFGAALSGPPPGPKAAACPVPGQAPGASCGAAPKGPPPGPKPTPISILTADSAGTVGQRSHAVTGLASMSQQVSQLFMSRDKNGGVMSREKLKCLLQILLEKHQGKTRLNSGQLDRVLDAFMDERSEGGDRIEACQFVEWTWGGTSGK